MIPTIDKHARVRKKTAKAMDHILTNYFAVAVFKTAIFKNNISDHFPICFLVPSPSTQRENKTTCL